MNSQTDGYRIGIFQADWPLQSQTANCAFMLARAGYEVDLFLDHVPQYFDIRSTPAFHENSLIRLHLFGNAEDDRHFPFPRPSNKTIAEKSIAFMVRLFRQAGITLGWKPSPVAGATSRQSASIIEGNDFRLFIGVEKKGLVWAGIMGNHFHIPYIYYSLELYTKDHPDAMVSPLHRHLKASEEAYHRKAAATIVQDAERARVLFQDNGLAEGLTFHVPVSLLGAARQGASSFFRDKYKLPQAQKIILQFGLFYNRRFSLELIETARQFPRDWTLILHGYSESESYHRQIEKKCHDRAILSSDHMPSDRIQDLIASADIGLVLYTSETKNDFMTAFSSEKLALFLQHGKPVIAFDYPGYRRLMEECDCGVLLRSLSELPRAVETILADWDRYSRNALNCFHLHYDYARNFMPVIDWINQGSTSHKDPPPGKALDG